MVKSIHNSKDSMKKVRKLPMKFSEFDCLSGCSVGFSFMLFETNFNFVI